MNQPIHQFKAEFFKALAHPARLAILEQLRVGEKSVGEIQTVLDTDQPTVSQQLARLRASNIVDSRKEGTTTYDWVRDPLLFALMDVARDIFNNQLISNQALLTQLRKANAPTSRQ
jgi:ArsR family transcriptional regulator